MISIATRFLSPSPAPARRTGLLTAAVLGFLLSAVPTAHGASFELLGSKSVQGVLQGVDNDGKTLLVLPKSTATTAPAAPTRVPLEDVLEFWLNPGDGLSGAASPALASTDPPIIERSAGAAPSTQPAATQAKKPQRWRVEFAAADHVTASLDDWNVKNLVMSLAAINDAKCTVPLDQIRAFWTTSDANAKKARDLNIKEAVQDVAFVEKDGEVKAVKGTVVGLNGDSLVFNFEGQDRRINLERLVGVALAEHEMHTGKALFEIFTLSNDDVLSGQIRSLSPAGFNIVMGTNDGDPSFALPLDKISKVKVRNGRLVWLTDLTPSQVEQQPYLDRLMPYRVNESLTGGRLQLPEGAMTRGIAVHSRCVLTYDLDGAFEKFSVGVGFQQPEGKAGRAAVRVLGDDKILWENADLKGDEKSSMLDLNVQGVKKLVLEVGYGKNQDVADRIIWWEPQLLKGASK